MWSTIATELSDDGLRFLLALQDLTVNNDIPLTLEGVCDAYGIPRSQALSVVKEVVEKGYAKKGRGTLKLAGEQRSVSFVTSTQDRLAQLEQENVQLKATMKARVLGESSGLADKLLSEERMFVNDIERTLGRGLSVNEAFLLGKCIQGWGVPRTRTLLKQKQDADNPFVIVYAILKNGGRGKSYDPPKDRAPRYRERKDSE